MLNKANFVVITFYKFVNLPHYRELKPLLLKICNSQFIRGTILLANEGINSTITGTQESIEYFQREVDKLPSLSDIIYKHSYASFQPFKRMKVLLKEQIVTFHSDCEFDPVKDVGKHLNSDEWDDLILRDDVMVVDTRNHYEVVFGTFKNAINPGTNSFSELVQWTSSNPDLRDKSKKIAMFCTGGVRCEKSTAYMRKLGYSNIYHLNGGILKYIEDKMGQDSLWQGHCFVFDDRIALDKNLEPLNVAVRQ